VARHANVLPASDTSSGPRVATIIVAVVVVALVIVAAVSGEVNARDAGFVLMLALIGFLALRFGRLSSQGSK
jgi:hypothetical protein